MGALIEDGEIEEARGKINEYMADERYEYMPESLQSTFYDYMLQINFRADFCKIYIISMHEILYGSDIQVRRNFSDNIKNWREVRV